MNEWEFYNELGRVPGPPDYLYNRIQKKLRRKALLTQGLYAIAAALLLTVGTTGYLVHRGSTGAALAPEVAEEMQFLHDYASGNDLNQQAQENVLNVAENLPDGR